MTKEYEDKFIKRIKTSSTDKELRLIINKMYEDGFEDGNELADKEEEPQKGQNKLPDNFVTRKDLHEVEMELAELCDNNKITREAIIDKFTMLMSGVEKWK